MFALTLLAFTAAANPVELKDGDRVVWIGSAIAEREQKYGHWETALLCKFADRNISFRNLGWSGDSVDGIARASFDPAAKGYERLIAKTKELKPTVLFVSYGANESFAGPTGVDKFEKGLEKLLKDLESTKARVVLFTPTPFEKAEGMTDLDNKNHSLSLYARAVRDVGDRQGHHVADLNSKLLKHTSNASPTFTENGIHFSDSGYEGTIPDFLGTLGLSWEGVEPKKYEAVRQAVIKKNTLFFDQWRPQNETYLFGFRKHEQGQNAKDIPAFEPLIEKADADIRKTLK
ncbi:hypothetical protein BH11PLA2_BH11PLA2_18500 [soil metagenome]